jgi:hypothetical protein
MIHLLLAEDESTMVQLIAAPLVATAMAFNKRRMNISRTDMGAPILPSVELGAPFVIPIQSR